MKNLISMRDLSKKEILHLMDIASKIEGGKIVPDMQRKLAALLFFEPSTRTMFSFDTAMKRMNGDTIIMSGTGQTSVKKGETFADTLQTIAQYSDIIIRTVHSLAQAMALFNVKFKFISPSFLKMPQYIKDDLKLQKVEFEEYENIEGNIDDLDILYVTRVQKERFADPEDYEKVKGSYILERSMLSNVKENFKVMHPLPRVNEIHTDVDNTEFAYYFPQAKNGVFTRQAIISTLLGEV